MIHSGKIHSRAAEVVAAIKQLDCYTDPHNYFESQLVECYEDSELVEDFGFNPDGSEREPWEACAQVVYRCNLLEDVHGWILEEGRKERGA